MTEVELIKLPEVRRITGMSTSFIYEKAAIGEFPRQVKLGARSVAWVRGEVVAWCNDKISVSRAS